MEVLPVNLDEFDVSEAVPFGEMGIKRYKMPEAAAGTYRVFLNDGTYQDIVADNASHAFQLVERTDVSRIINVKHAYSQMLASDILQPTEEEVRPSIDVNIIHEPVVAELPETIYGTFELIGLAGLAKTYSNSAQ